MNLAVIAALLLLFPVGLLVPSLMTGTESPSQETVLEPVGTTDRELEQKDVELDMMHFSPSASNEDGIHYVARRGVDAIAYFGKSEVWYVVGNTLVRLQFPGSMRIIPVGEETTGSVTNYMFGNDPSRWKNGLTDCAVLRYVEIYSGIDLVYRFLDGNLKYEFVVAPHADPGMIQMRYPDADIVEVQEDSLTVSKNGFKVVDTGLTALEKGLGDGDVECTFRSRDTSTIAFSMGRYDASCELIVDPIVLVYSSFLGGGTLDDVGYGIAVENGSIYVTGYTESTGFPTVNAYDSTFNGVGDCFVTKLAVDGQSLVYSTFLGGSSPDYGYGIAVEGGFAYVTGQTSSSDFPVVSAYDGGPNGGYDCFVTKLAVNGQFLVYSTFFGGTGGDRAYGIAVEDGFAYVTGQTSSSDFPTVNAVDSAYSVNDCFVTMLAVDGQSLVYSTFLGGSDEDYGAGIAAEEGSAYIAGYTRSADFPTVTAYDWSHDGSRDCFIAVISGAIDTDMDGLSDRDEAYYGTNRFCIDSDNDNFLDGYEVAYGSDPTDPMSYPGMPQTWYDIIYKDLDGNTTLIQQVISWLDGNHTAIETLFFCLEGNATLLIQTVNAVNANTDQLDLLAALVTQNTERLTSLNATHIGDMAQIRAILSMLGVTVGNTDCDGLDDLDEIAHGSDTQCMDTDCDNLNDAYEVRIGTDPTDDDSDNDTYLDGQEVMAGTDPLDPLDYPGRTGTPTDPTMGIVLTIVTGGVGFAAIIALLVVMRRRAGAGSHS